MGCAPWSEMGFGRTNISKWWRRGILVVYRCYIKNLRFVWDGMSLLPWVMLSLARGWGMRDCTLSWVWLVSTWEIIGKNILSLCIIMLLPLTWTKARWNTQSLGRWVWTIMWVFRIATFCKVLTNRHFSYEEAFGCYSCQHFVSYVRERSILPKPVMGYSIEVHGYGCVEGGFNMKDQDESSWYWNGKHF